MASDNDDEESYSSSGSELTDNYNINENASQEIISLEPTVENIIRLTKQKEFLQRMFDKERSARMTAENKRQSLESDNTTNIQKIKALSEDRLFLEKHKIELEGQLSNLELKFMDESEKKKMAESQIEKLKQQLRGRNVVDCEGDIEYRQKHEMTLKTLQDKLLGLEKSKTELEKERDDLLNELNDKRTAWLLQREEQNESENSRSDCNDEIERLKLENKELQDMIESYKETIKYSENTLTDAVNQHMAQKQALQKELDKVNEELNSKELANNELIECKKELSQLKSSKVTDLKKFTDNEIQLKQEELMTKRLLEEKNDELKDMMNNLKNLEKKLVDSETRLETAEKELANANSLLSDKNNRLSNLTEEKKKVQNEIEKVQDDYKQEKVEKVKLQAKIDDLEDRLKDLQQKESTLKKELATIGKHSKDSDELNVILNALKVENENTISELQNKTKQLSQKMNEVNEQLDKSVQDKELLEKQVKELKEFLDTLGNSNNKSENEMLDLLKAENEQLKRKTDYLLKELNETKEELKTSESKLSDMAGKLQICEKELFKVNLLLSQKNEELESTFQQLRDSRSQIKDVMTDQTRMRDLDEATKRAVADCLEADKELGKDAKENDILQTNVGGKKTLNEPNSSDNDETNQYDKEKLKAELRAIKKKLKEGDSEGDSDALVYGSDRERMKKRAKLLMDKLKQAKRKEKMKVSDSDNEFDSVRAELNPDILEIEARIRMELNQKLAAINSYLHEHAELSEKLDRLREGSNDSLRNDMTTSESELLKVFAKVKESAIKQPPSSNGLWSPPQCFDKADEADKMLRASDLDDRCYSSNLPFNIYIHVPSSSSYRYSQLPFDLRQELDRSIAKHLEKGPQIELPSHSDRSAALTSSILLNQEKSSTYRQNYFLT